MAAATSGAQAPATGRGAIVAFGALQVAFALGWVAYAVYLPDLAERAGIAAKWVIVILLVDQLIFAVTDVLAGIAIARLRAWQRSLPWLLLAGAIASVCFAALPWVSGTGASTGFLMVAFAWTLSTTALRVPPFALLGERLPIGERSVARMLVLALGLASVAAPFLAPMLKLIDPMLPFVLASVVVLAAALVALTWAARLPAIAPALRAPVTARRAIAPLAWVLLAVLFAFGAQLHSAVASPALWPAGGHGAVMREVLLAVFGAGTAFGALVGMLVRTTGRRPECVAGALALGAIALGSAAIMPASWVLSGVQLVAGLAWGFGLVALFEYASEYSRTTARWVTGCVFGALALAAAARLLLAANTDAATLAAISFWLAPLTWVVALVLAVALSWRSPATETPLV